MKIKDITNAQAFFRAVNECKGHVELMTQEGDRLNLKSTLCQYIALTQMFQDERISGVELVMSEPEDFDKLSCYLIPE